MTRISKGVFSIVLVSLASVGGCASSPSFPPPHPGEAAQICRSMCSARARCGENLDAETCEETCVRQSKTVPGVRWDPYWRADYVSAVTSCLSTASCDVIKTAAERRGECFAKTRPAPSDSARRFCSLAVSQDSACRVYYDKPENHDLEHCVSNLGMVDDSVLVEMTKCQERGCGTRRDSRWTCVYDLVGLDNKY